MKLLTFHHDGATRIGCVVGDEALVDRCMLADGSSLDECTVEDIMYEIDFIAQVMDGLRDADEGRTISTEELLVRVKK
jgi:hypothetical protein